MTLKTLNRTCLCLLLACLLAPVSVGAAPITLSFTFVTHSHAYGDGSGHATVLFDPAALGENGSLLDFYFTYAGLVWTQSTAPRFADFAFAEYLPRGPHSPDVLLIGTGDSVDAGRNSFNLIFEPVTPALGPGTATMGCRDCAVGIDSAGIILTSINTVPEPSSLLLVGGGLTMLGRTTWRRLRRRRDQQA